MRHRQTCKNCGRRIASEDLEDVRVVFEVSAKGNHPRLEEAIRDNLLRFNEWGDITRAEDIRRLDVKTRGDDIQIQGELEIVIPEGTSHEEIRQFILTRVHSSTRVGKRPSLPEDALDDVRVTSMSVKKSS